MPATTVAGIFLQRGMSVNILGSRHDQSIQEYIYQELVDHHKKQNKAYLVVPEQFTLQSDIHLLESLQINASMDIRVKSFSSLANEVLGRVGIPGREYLSEIGRELLVRQAMEDQQDVLQFFVHDNDKIGVVSALTRTIAELRMINVSTEDFFNATEGETLAESTRKKVHDLAVLLSRYDELLSHHYLDVEARLVALQEILPQATWLQDVHFYFYGFHSMNQLELNILSTLIKLNKNVHIAVVLPDEALGCTDMTKSVEENDAFQASWRFYKKLLNLDPHASFTKVDNIKSIPESLQILAMNTFQWRNVEKKLQSNHISFQQATSSDQEIIAIAQLIRHRIINDGMRYRDFTISVTNANEYYPLIRRIFRAHHIPVFIDEKRRILENAYVKALLSAIDAVESNLKPDDVFCYLKSGFTGINFETILAYERHVRNRNLRGTMLWTKKYFVVDDERYNNRPDTLNRLQEEAAMAYEGAQQFRQQMEDFYHNCQGRQSVRSFATMMYFFMTQPQIKESLEIFQEQVCSLDNKILSNENFQIMQLIVDYLEQLVTALGDRVVGFSEFAKLFRHGIEKLTVGIIPPAQDQVLVGSLNRTRTRRTPYQIIIGMADLWLPSPRDDNSVFLSEEKEDLSLLGFDLPSADAHQLDEEILSLYQAFTRPTEKLVLSWPLSDHSGQTVNKARIVNQILSLIDAPKITSAMSISEKLKAYSEPVALSWTMREYRHWQKDSYYLKEDPEKERILGSYLTYFMAKTDERKNFLKSGLYYSNKRKPLSLKTVKKIYRAFDKEKTSITELEIFRTCPYKHFIRFGLKPVEDDKIMIEKREMGTLVHTVLNKFTTEMSKDPIAFLSQSQEQINRLIDDYISLESKPLLGKERIKDKRNRAVIKSLTKTTKKAGQHIVRQLLEGSFNEVEQEVFFGKKDGIPQIVLQIGDEKLYLEGSIDRIDSCGSRIRVIDYKTGAKAFDLARALDGLDLQLLLYLRVALGLSKGKKPAGVFYLNLNDVLIKDETNDPERIKKALIESVLMDGLIVEDEEVIQAMDKDACHGEPKVLRFRGRKANILDKDNVISEKKLLAMTDRAFQIADKIVSDIADGVIDVYPAVINDNLVCSYCDYRGMCRYEEGMPNRMVRQYSWEDLDDMTESFERSDTIG